MTRKFVVSFKQSLILVYILRPVDLEDKETEARTQDLYFQGD